MGKACTRTLERVHAATGKIDQAEVRFEDLNDVKGGGVLFALPALLMNGLLKNSDGFFNLPKGFYALYNIFLLLGFMALSRVKNIEQLRNQEPGEWGKVMGLDRIPEVRTLRERELAVFLRKKKQLFNGAVNWPKIGWITIPVLQGCYMWTAMFVFIMDHKPSCPDVMYPDKNWG